MRFNRCVRLLALCLFAVISAGHTCAQSTPAVDPNVVLKVSVATDQQEFRMGETIPLQLSFTSTVKNQYQLNLAQYDRSGRMNYEQFNISPAGGSVDPLPNVGSMGGLTSFKFLTAEPWTIKLNLNEWVRFTQPGEYRLIVLSSRVGVRDPASMSGTSTVTARSNQITLKIVRADAAWQKRIFDEAVAKLDTPSHQSNQYEQNETHKQALETLRFLGTAEATRELVKRMRGQARGSLEYICMLGIISSPKRAVARTALEEALADPDQGIGSTFLYTLRTVSSDNNANWKETSQRNLEQLLAALPAKRGQAFSISLSTALNEAWNVDALPPQPTEKLMAQVITLFDKLPLNEQNALLSYRWEKIKSPALLPILKRYAQEYHDFPEMRAEPAFESLQLSGAALRHWYELDPAGARSAIITEISRPRPRFDAHLLGLLPDKTLPELDFVLAENFRAAEDYEGKSNLASLIARYATDAILPQVIEQLDPMIGKWACNIQTPLLAYVLRVSPESAGSLIKKAIAARGKGFSACNHELFQVVSEIHYDPILEDVAIESLNDSDPEVAGGAATLLGKFGSPAAQPALLKRYESWSEQWTGRERELERIFADGLNAQTTYQLTLGLNLARALASGSSWLTDGAELQNLARETKVRRVRQELETYIKLWQGEPVPILIDSSATDFHARVVQYEFQSLDALKEKLAHFPSGTRFTVETSTTESSASETVAELRKFLLSHGMTVK
ncbi:MAG TPA: HEAT repeat domain-containing protein [Pyrinomonadaceae bacterium]|nr:HEAT repeat domain-containing protein [Pyrinomonadaceae bacterium]